MTIFVFVDRWRMEFIAHSVDFNDHKRSQFHPPSYSGPQPITAKTMLQMNSKHC